jgi:N-alpha-acetyl-L-2,4-diaminobutyrate deacetylase
MRRNPLEIKLGADDPGQSTSLIGWRYRTGEKGPRVLVTGAVHGDEVTSAAAIWYVAEGILDWVTEGAVTLIPCVNQLAVRASQRLVPLENVDLNRRFPGRPDGTLADRIAAALVTLLEGHDALIDVHTAGWAVPFVLLDHFVDRKLEARVTAWAETSGLPVVGEMPARISDLAGLDRSWSAWAVKLGKPAVTMELPGFHTLDLLGAHRGANGVLNMLTAAPTLRQRSSAKSKSRPRLVRRSIHAEHGGLFEAERKPGDVLRKGERIGWLRSLVGEKLGAVTAPAAGLLIEVQPISAVHVGRRLATLAVDDRQA